MSTQKMGAGEGPDLAQEHFVDVTPRPIFTRLKGSNDGMTGGVKMFRGMAVRRRIATTHMSARQTEPQMDPGRTDLQAFFAAVCAGNDIAFYLIEMGAGFGAHDVMPLQWS